MTCYVLVFRHIDLDRQIMLDFLDTLPEVQNWRAAVGAIYIISDATATSIADEIHRKFPALQFVLSKVDILHSNGWADKETWDFINLPGLTRNADNTRARHELQRAEQ